MQGTASYKKTQAMSRWQMQILKDMQINLQFYSHKYYTMSVNSWPSTRIISGKFPVISSPVKSQTHCPCISNNQNLDRKTRLQRIWGQGIIKEQTTVQFMFIFYFWQKNSRKYQWTLLSFISLVWIRRNASRRTMWPFLQLQAGRHSRVSVCVLKSRTSLWA